MPTVTVTGGDNVRHMLDGFSGQKLQNRLRRSLRAGAKPFQAGLKAEAASEPTGNLPHSFVKVPAAKVSASRRRGGTVVARVRPKSPLFNIFEPGAGPHEITGGLMGGPGGTGTWTSEGRKRRGRFAARGRVHHPGMKARPILPSAFGARVDDARREVARVLFAPGES